jgi:cell division protein FtsB
MNNRLKNGIALSIIPQIIIVKSLGSYPELVENYYSKGLYPFISQSFRIAFGWFPWSIGDLIYAILIILAIRYIVVKRNQIRENLKLFFRDIVLILSVAYFTFHLMWGFNYYRVPLSQTLDLKDTYTTNELIMFTEKLIERTNKLQYEVTSDTSLIVNIPYNQKEIFQKTLEGYSELEISYPFFSYKNRSLKKSIFSTALTYMGYGGYLNPFTNEAQVNSKIPNFRFPVVTGHEIGHQVGYSAENEVNFIGYLVTANNKDLYFKYSAAAYALSYSLSEIKSRDETKFRELYARLNRGVQKNYEELNKFWLAYENPFEPLFKSVFNTFLKANNQEEGIKSYSLIVTLLVTYDIKYPIE